MVATSKASLAADTSITVMQMMPGVTQDKTHVPQWCNPWPHVANRHKPAIVSVT